MKIYTILVGVILIASSSIASEYASDASSYTYTDETSNSPDEKDDSNSKYNEKSQKKSKEQVIDDGMSIIDDDNNNYDNTLIWSEGYLRTDQYPEEESLVEIPQVSDDRMDDMSHDDNENSGIIYLSPEDDLDSNNISEG